MDGGAGAILFFVVALAFLAALVAVASRLHLVMRAPRGRAWVFLAAVVVLSCLFQAMSIYAENARFGMPFRPISVSVSSSSSGRLRGRGAGAAA